MGIALALHYVFHQETDDGRTEGYTYDKHDLNCVDAENAIEDLAVTDQFW